MKIDSRISLSIGLVMCMLIAVGFDASHADAATFSRTLSVGSTGSDVVVLQKFLNVSPTGYFGPLTAAAVSRFQETYASEILWPSGLSRGTAMVGPATLAALNRRISPISEVPVAKNIAAPVTSAVPIAAPAAISSTIQVPTQGPNTKNLGIFLDSMAKVSAKQGLTQAQIDILKTELIKQAISTTTDFRQAFIQSVQAKAAAKHDPQSSLAQAVDALVEAGKDFIGIKHAQAVLDLPFGGALLYASPCLCSGTIYLTVQPLAPTYISTLTYTPFSQAYLSYNIPYTEWLLGEYTPFVGRCLIPALPTCYYIPVEGQVSPTVGTSMY